jgi:hypothetical protein
MIRRRLVREFPWFLTYTGLQIAQEGTLFFLDHSSSVTAEQYWQAYWAGSILSMVLRSAVIYEVFCHLFRPYPAISGLGRVVFRWASVVLLLVAVAVAAYAPGDDTVRLLSGVNVVNRAVSMVQCGLLFFLFLFASYFRLSWRSYVFGIALGLGIFSSVDLATAAIQVQTWPAAGSYVIDFVTMGTYHCCVLIWLFYMLAPESVGRTVQRLPSHQLEEWNAELQRLLLQ